MLFGIVIGCGIWIAFPYFARDGSNAKIARLFAIVYVGELQERSSSRLLESLDGQTAFAGKNQWMIAAPSRFLQDHWVLVVCLGEGKVLGKRIGTADEIFVTPRGAPAAEGSCHR
jgi:hypothetical protein